MRRSMKARLLGVLGTAAVVAGLALTATGTTGAYFSDTKSGTLTGTVGSIKVATSGGTGTDGLNLGFTNLLPGEPQTLTANYTNTGLNAEDVWVVFPNAGQLGALNNLGHYGEAHLANDGTAVFDSANLNDDSGGRCGPLSPTGCWPLPHQVKLASNVAPSNDVHAFGFTFQYSHALSTQTPAGGGTWNKSLTDLIANGLPYQIVATQVGQTP